MLKYRSTVYVQGGGYATYNVSLGKRLWLSLILSFICAALLCCAFLLPESGNASAAVAPSSAIEWQGIKNYLRSQNGASIYGITSQLTDFTEISGATADGNSTFDSGSAKAAGKKTKVAKSYFVASYVHYKAVITVPAYTEYQVDFSCNMQVKSKSGGSGTASSWMDVYVYGETDTSNTVTFGYVKYIDATSTGQPMGYADGDIKKREHLECKSSSTGTGFSTSKNVADLYTATYSNSTANSKTFEAYFGAYMGSPSGSADTFVYDSSATMSTKITVTSVSAPTVDNTEADYNKNGNVFNFTYDHDRVEVKSVSYLDVANQVSDVTSATVINTDGSCTLTNAGTYTFTFKIKDNCGAVWNSTTNDQTDKTLTVTINYKTLTSPSGTVETEYNGEDQSLDTLTTPPSWYDATIYSDTSIIALDDKFTDAGENEVTVTIISGEYYWNDYESNPTKSRTFKFKINKKKLEVTFGGDGNLVAQYDETQLYERDKAEDKKPKLATKYSKTASLDDAVDSPTGLGQWYALAVLENECNYYVEAMQAFEASKNSVAYPVLSASSNATENYNGSEQIFTFDGFDSELMTFAVPDGAESFDGTTLKVKKAGTYTIVYTLTDTELNEWSGNTTLQVTVEKKNVIIIPEASNLAEWEKGDNDVELKFRVTGLVAGESVKLSATYSKNGAGSSSITVTDNGDGTQTVTIPKTYGTGSYTLTVKVADGENYVEREAAVHNFTITAEGLDLGENEITWEINGVNHTVDEYKDGFLEIEYSGKPLTVSVDISLSESAAELQIDGYGGNYETAVDVGEYTATVHVVAEDPAKYSFDETYTLNIKIVPKKLTFEDAEWQWQYADDTEWQPLTDSNMPSFDNKAVSVRISPEYFEGVGLAEGEYTLNYHHGSDLTEKGDKSTSVEITITNPNYTTGNDGYIHLTKNWKITAKALKYNWTATQPITAGDNTFEFPAIAFEDGNDYSQYYEYYFTVDGDDTTEYTKAELEKYIQEHWTETNAVSGKVYVRMLAEQDEVVIKTGYRAFSTGTPKTALTVTITAEGAEYGKVDFSFTVLRGTTDESARTAVTITGGALEEEKTFAGNSAELTEFIKGLKAGSYNIKVSVSDENYTLTGDCEFTLNVKKFRITEDMWNKDGKEGAVLELPEWVNAMLANPETLKINYCYYNDIASEEMLEEVTFEGGKTYYVNAVLTGSEAGNFEFENGVELSGAQVSSRVEYSIPKTFGQTVTDFVKDNLALVIGIGIGLLLLIILIIFLARRRKHAGYDDDYYDDDYDYDEDDDEDEDDEEDDDEDY